ncbi:MAG: YfcC family protein [bacterium]|nr:YfcC family protein [bacterium]
MKLKFSFPTAYTITIIIIIITAALTWFMPAGSYNYRIDGTQTIIQADKAADYTGDKKLLPVPHTYQVMPSHPQGVFAIVQAPIQGLYESAGIAFFVLIIGGFLGLSMKTGALDALIVGLIKKLKGKESLMIVVLMCVLALGGTTFSMGEETIAFYPLLIPIMFMAGYDSFVCVLVLVLGTQTGCLAAIASPFSTSIASRFIGVSMGEGMGLRIIMLLVILFINIVIVLRYASKIKKDPSKSLVADKKKEIMEHYDLTEGETDLPDLTPRRVIVNIIFILTFVVYIYGVLPFDSMGITFLPTLGWGYKQMTALFAVGAIIIGIVYGMKEKDIVDHFITGACDLLGVAVIIGLARGITVVMSNGLILDTILNWAEIGIANYSSVLCLNLIYFVHIILAFFIPSTSGLAAITMPIMGPLAVFKGIPKDLVVTAYMAASGIVNFVTPTSAIVMGGLILAKASYIKYLKFLIPRLIFVLIASMIILSLGLLF